MSEASKIEGDLWCMHIQGPDDIHAAPDFWTALAWAAELNGFIAAKAIKNGWAADDNYPLTQATVRPWTGTRESHAVLCEIEIAERAEHAAKQKEAALSAPSPQTGGSEAEPVAWAYEELKTYTFDMWEHELSYAKPEAAPHYRNIRPLYERPPVAAETVAGWKLVPVDPTEAMLKAFWLAALTGGSTEAYRAMLAAAPTPPAGDGGTGQELAQIRAMLLSDQGDDDGSQILPDFDEGMSVAAMISRCIHLLEQRRDVLNAYKLKPDETGTPAPQWQKLYANECKRQGAARDFDIEDCIRENFPQVCSASPAGDLAGLSAGATPTKPYDPVRGWMAEGCCSACSPCSHQKRDPYSICDVCQKAAAIGAERTRLSEHQHSVAKAASERAAKNANVAPELLYAPILWAIQDAPTLPAAPRKGSSEEEIKAILYNFHSSPPAAMHEAARQIAALYADRGETRGEDGADTQKLRRLCGLLDDLGAWDHKNNLFAAVKTLEAAR